MNPDSLPVPRSLAIRTRFSHHAASSGYSQLLRYTRPVAEVGIDERGGKPARWPYRNYHWLYEFDAAFLARRLQADLIHVLYAENYFRFLKSLCPGIPVVATFHQPPELLASELRTGSFQGRVAGLTHRLTSGRFAKLAAAIITSEAQRAALEGFVDRSKIHHVPLGISATELMVAADEACSPREGCEVLTVGNWKRDWSLYFDFVRLCGAVHPDWRFTLINRQLPQSWRDVARDFANVRFLPGVEDHELFGAYKAARVQFLPLEGAAGNNAVNESLAFGCPVVSNVDLGFGSEAAQVVVDSGPAVADLLRSVEGLVLASDERRRELSDQCRRVVLRRDWREVASRTIEIYRSVA
jgi:glycosyltransferase involved in cell wall biosynthesis